MRRSTSLSFALLAASGLCGQSTVSHRLTVNVPATSNPYLAGLPNGTKARDGDSAPQQSPVLVERSLSYAVAVTFRASGATQHMPNCPPDCRGPNGAEFVRHRGGAEHKLSDVTAPMDSLVGVFLSDESPDNGNTPKPLDFRSRQNNSNNFMPELKQIFFIGDGRTASTAPQRFLVPARATRLYLGVMDEYEWNNNSGSFTVEVTIEGVDSAMFAVDSRISFQKWACLPDHARCTPDRPVAEEKAPGEFHVILPASSEWGISVPDAKGRAAIHDVEGTVCLSAGACSGPEGSGVSGAGPGFLAEDKPVGALLTRRIEGRIYFSVNHRVGAAFRNHEGYYEFDVTIK